MAIFFDRQHEANPLNGSDIKEAAPMLQAIEELRTREPSFFELESEKGTRLLVGVAPNKRMRAVQRNRCGALSHGDAKIDGWCERACRLSDKEYSNADPAPVSANARREKGTRDRVSTIRHGCEGMCLGGNLITRDLSRRR